MVCIIASVTIITASLIALSQDNLKSECWRFPPSDSYPISYLGVGLLSPKGITGGMLHIAMHAFGKITLFFCAGAIFVATGKRNISEMVGIGQKNALDHGGFFCGLP